jgi:hypothetical protein
MIRSSEDEVEVQRFTAVNLSEVDFGQLFLMDAFGLVQVGFKISFDEARELPGIVFLSNEGHQELKIPALIDARSFQNESVLIMGKAQLRPSIDRAKVKFGVPSHRNYGSMILDHEQRLILRCFDGQRGSRDVDTSRWMVAQRDIARPRFWFSSASIVVPADAGTFQEIASITASGED